MSVKTTTTTLHESECDRCHLTGITSGKPGPGTGRLPDGWLSFSISWSDRSGSAASPRTIDLCQECMGHLTILGCLGLFRQREQGQQPGGPPDPPWRPAAWPAWLTS